MAEYFLILEKENRKIVDVIEKNETQSLALRYRIRIDKSSKKEFFDICLKAIRKKGDKEYLEMIECPNPPGTFFRRIYRPCIRKEFIQSLTLIERETPLKLPSADKHLTHNSIQELRNLIKLQEDIFGTVHPHHDNFKCYGMAIRNLLILSCTELESQLRGILDENGIQKNRYNTKDFVRLDSILKLKEYSVKFRNYPWFGIFSPFQHWASDKPTVSLTWYNNYNAVKHDRHKEIKKGDLASALMSIIGLVIVLRAQFENDEFVINELEKTFEFSLPSWKDEEKYIPPVSSKAWVVKNIFE